MGFWVWHRSLARTWLNFTLDRPSCFPLILCSQTSGSASAPSVLWGTAEGMLCGLLLVFELGLLKLASFFPVSHRPHPSMSPAPVSWWPHRRSAWVLWPDELSFTRGQNDICGLHTTLQRLCEAFLAQACSKIRTQASSTSFSIPAVSPTPESVFNRYILAPTHLLPAALKAVVPALPELLSLGRKVLSDR